MLRLPIALAPVCALLLACALLAPAGRAQDLPYADLAAGYRTRHAVTASEPIEVTLQEVLDTAYVSARVGLFDARYPKSALGDADGVAEFRDVVRDLVRLQHEWLELFGDGGATKSVRADLAKLDKFLKSAKPAPQVEGESREAFLDYLQKGAEHAERLAAVEAALADPAVLGSPRRREGLAPLVFAPSRLDFLEASSFIGWLDVDWRGAYWVDGVAYWSEFFWNEYQFVALTYPPVMRDDDNLDAGIEMDEREATGKSEHVVQRAAHSLTFFLYENDLEGAFESGLCQELVVRIVGSNNTRSGGSGTGSAKDAWSVFVPGGNSNGGPLPRNDADSTWRQAAGKDHFVSVLRSSQKVAGKENAKDKRERLTWFLLSDPAQRGSTFAIQGPFLGSAAVGKTLPEATFLPDYREFFRAYKTAFVHWLLEASAGKRKSEEACAKVAAVLRLMAEPRETDLWGTDDPPPAFQAALEEAFELPLSDPDPAVDTLEMRFLEWLSKQK